MDVYIDYCNTPTQYYWVRTSEYLKANSVGALSGLYKIGLRVLLPFVRAWDLKAAKRPDFMLANSSVVKDRVKNIYHRDSEVLFPPVDTSRFAMPSKRPQRKGFVIAGRQVHHKRFDLAIRACNELGLPLTVIGRGPMHHKLKSIAGPTITFRDSVSDQEMPSYFHKAEAFIFPNEEDFGVTPVEAMAAGCPVIAFRAGGALDTVVENITGVFFDKQNIESLKMAIVDLQKRHFSEDRISAHAKQFDSKIFQENIKNIIFKYCS